jgi:hypothetical protein
MSILAYSLIELTTLKPVTFINLSGDKNLQDGLQ